MCQSCQHQDVPQCTSKSQRFVMFSLCARATHIVYVFGFYSFWFVRASRRVYHGCMVLHSLPSQHITYNVIYGAGLRSSSSSSSLLVPKLYNTKAITKSVLLEFDKHLQSIKKLDDTNTFITPDSGGHMFFTVFTAHMMDKRIHIIHSVPSRQYSDFHEPENVLSGCSQ